ncbi:MAG: dihydrolipoamide acyltransferase [Sulfuriferula sp.]
MNKGWGIIVIVTVTMLGACTNIPTRITPASWQGALLSGQTDDLLVFYDGVRKQSAAELNKEYEKARQQLVQNKTDFNRMRLALLLTLPNAVFHDDAAAMNLLNDVLKDAKTNTSSVHGLASLLLSELAEKQRVADDLTQKLKIEQKRGDELQVKVEAIKDMEKNMTRRDKRQ